MTIRTKLYAAIIVTVAGLSFTAGVGIWALNQLSSRFDNVQSAADARAIALGLKFDVTDFNGWQTAYGYDNGRSRPIFLAAVKRFRMDFAHAQSTLTGARERQLLNRIESGAGTFMQIDAQAWAALQAGRTAEVRRLFLGPEITTFHQIAAVAEELAVAQNARADREQRAFRSSRKDALRLLILAALVAAFFVLILLVTANDLAREAEAAGQGREPGSAEGAEPGSSASPVPPTARNRPR